MTTDAAIGFAMATLVWLTCEYPGLFQLTCETGCQQVTLHSVQ